jgi:hypothetical protein
MTIKKWLYKFLMSRRNVAPKLRGQTCAINGCNEPATDQWFPSVCALREAGVEIDWVPVCPRHDTKINQFMVRFFFGSKYEQELADYYNRRIIEEPKP